MTRARRVALGVIIALVTASVVVACSVAPKPKESGMLTRDEAIAIATAYIEDKVEISEGAEIVVHELEDAFIIEWKVVPVERGPDFDARVKVDKATGEVVEHMVGS